MASGGLDNMASEELWRECASWLTRCDVLRNDHKANWPNASIVDLAYILRDGVLLCNLLNTLDPGCIDDKDVNQKPQMAQFLCLRNIGIFLETCRDIFGLKEADLFEPLMLFDLTNFHRVLCTLAKLSNSAKAQRRQIPGFSVQRHGSREDIYQSLRSIGSGGVVGSACSWVKFSIRCPRLDDHQEDVYEDLCYVTFSPRSSLDENARGPPVEKRDHVIKELLDTEKNYVDVLKTLKFQFMKPLSNMLKADVLIVIFKDIPELYEIHSEFYKHLHNFYTEEDAKLSTTFLNFQEKFLIYGSYCANLTEAQAVLQDECDQNQILNQEVIRCQNEANNGKFKLRDVLSVPMQRILKYHLLLGKLIEETHQHHEEHNALKRAREAMLDVATYINEVKRDSDHLALLKQVQENIIEWVLPADNPLSVYGRLLKDGELKIKSHDDQKIHMRYVFIFDKIMVLCKPARGGQFAFKEYLHLHDFVLEDVNNRPILNREARWSYQWLLVKRDRSSVYTLYAQTIDLKRKMMKAIADALDNLEPQTLKKTTHRFEMHTFKKPVTCNRCSKFLKGLIYQGYHCRVCGIAVHKDCIGQAGRCGCDPTPVNTGPGHHIDEMFREYLWYAGEMERITATTLLEARPRGTFLVRLKREAGEQGGETPYALSLKTSDTVRHMLIFKVQVEKTEQYYLSECRFFKTIPDLVRFYEHTSLRENYEKLEDTARLQWPYRQLIAEAECDWRPDGREPGQITLKSGCRVVVLDKSAGSSVAEDWWKGRVQAQVGLFPRQCVRILREVTHETFD